LFVSDEFTDIHFDFQDFFFCYLLIFDPLFLKHSYYMANFEAPDPLFSSYSYCVESFESLVATHGHLLITFKADFADSVLEGQGTQVTYEDSIDSARLLGTYEYSSLWQVLTSNQTMKHLKK
jgi:hypothetical protein